VNIRAGKYKPPVGLERLQADAETEFVERGLPTNVVPNRDVGIQWGGAVFAETVSYQFGVFNGNIDNSIVDTDANDEKDYMGRVFLEPFRNGESLFRGLGFGIAYAYGVQQGTAAAGASNLPQYRTVEQQVFFSFDSGAFADGPRTRLSPQFYWFAGPLGLLGEYVAGKQEVTRSTNVKRNVDVTAWQLAAFWVLTGEDASFRNPTPRRAFNPAEDAWGAVELVARYGVQGIDEDVFVGTAATALADPAASAQEARSAGIGVNWYFSRNFKIQANYDRTEFDLGAAGGTDRPAENAIFTRFQANF
jgi:phosphate-selective porin OprO/OprP